MPIRRLKLSLLVLVLGASASASAAGEDHKPSLDERFASPPARFRILKITHNVPPTDASQDALLAKLAAQGFGGMVTNCPSHDYLQSDAQWQAFIRAVHAAKARGMALWLYDERGYPSGNAGGLTLREHPEWQAEGLLVADALSGGGRVELAAPPGQLFRAAAFPVVGEILDLLRGQDLSGGLRDGKLVWEAPAGKWHVMLITRGPLYEGTHAELNLHAKIPYINLLRPEPTAKFLELTHAAYARRLGDDLGKWFIATFTDEPSLMSLYLRGQPHRPLPWAPDLAPQFKARRGYALEPFVPALVADAGPAGARARYDFWLTVGELVAENFFGQIRAWCRRHNVPSGGHLLMEESLLAHVPLYGDFFRCARNLDAPSIDCLTSLPQDVAWFIARLISSAGELEGRADTMCETSDFAQHYRRPDDKRPVRVVSEDEIRGTCHRLIVSGITTITSYYSFAGLSDAQLERLNLHLGRCSAMLYGGRQAADVAVLYPVESLWPRFTPSRDNVREAPSAARQIETIYRQASSQLFTHGRDFTYIDSRTLAAAESGGGALRYRELQWRALVLPAVDTLPVEAWENVARFWRAGGLVIALGALPANSQREFPAPAVQALAQELFGDAGPAARAKVNPAGGVAVFLPAGAEPRLPTVLDRLLEADVRFTPPNVPLRVTHRRIDGGETFFVINDSPDPCAADARFAVLGPGRQYDPRTGGITPVTDAAHVRVKLGPYGGMLFRFDKPLGPARLPTPSERELLQ